MKKEQKLIEDAKLLYKLYEQLTALGFKHKDLAKAIGLYPSAFSALFNKIIKPIIILDQESANQTDLIQQIFTPVNNVSETKTRRRFPMYIERFQRLKTESSGSVKEKMNDYIAHLVAGTPAEIMNKLEGIYHCYYLSSFGYKIKREPLMIKRSMLSDGYEIRKGNKAGPSRYEGFGYISNSHLFTIQLKELETLIPDNFLAHFHLPPSYSKTMKLLKGIAVSMSNGYLPISRKIILNKVDDHSPVHNFEKEATIFFEKEEATDNPIVQYLRNAEHLLEYTAVPRPVYDENDLIREVLTPK